MEHVESMNVWVRRNRAEAFKNMGKAFISARWDDVNKGDDENPNYRNSPNPNFQSSKNPLNTKFPKSPKAKMQTSAIDTKLK